MSAFLDGTKPVFYLKPSTGDSRPSILGIPEPLPVPIGGDGTFRMTNVLVGEYQISLPLMRPDYYIKQARYGAVDALDRPFQFRGVDSEMLEIVISPNVGSVDGIVTTPLGPAQGSQVVLIPDRNRSRPELFRAVTSDQNGRFTIPGVAPGEYKLFAWEAIET